MRLESVCTQSSMEVLWSEWCWLSMLWSRVHAIVTVMRMSLWTVFQKVATMAYGASVHLWKVCSPAAILTSWFL